MGMTSTQLRAHGDEWVKAVWRDTELTTGQKVVAGALVRYRNTDPENGWFGKAWPVAQTLADDCALKENTIRVAIAELKKRGYIRISKAQTPRYQRNVYTFVVPQEKPDKGGSESIQNASIESEETDTLMTVTDTLMTVTNHLDDSHGKAFNIPSKEIPNLYTPQSELGRESADKREPQGIEAFNQTSVQHYYELVADEHDLKTSFTEAVRIFTEKFADERRRDWASAFKHFIGAAVRDDGKMQGHVMDRAIDAFHDHENEKQGSYT